jgi:predicted tellurium resistance membrane protein TerC
MAVRADSYSVHKNLAIISGAGSAIALFGLSGYFMSYEYEDFDRVPVSDRTNMELHLTKRKKTSKIIAIVGILCYIIGIVLLVLSIGLYHDEKEELGKDISSIVKQLKKKKNEPETNEPVILASLASVVILMGLFQSLRNFHHTESFGLIGLTLYSVGWIANAFAASMQNNSIYSANNERLSWTLPGAVAIVLGTASLPWQIRHKYVSGFSLPLSALGYTAYTIGNVAVLK